MHKVVRFLSRAYLTLAGLVILIGYAGIWYKDGFSALQDIVSPYNVINYIAVVATLAPGMLLNVAADKLEARKLRLLKQGSNVEG